MYENLNVGAVESDLLIFSTNTEGLLAANALMMMPGEKTVTVVQLDGDTESVTQSRSVTTWHNGIRNVFAGENFEPETQLSDMRPVVSTATLYDSWGEYDPFYLPEDTHNVYVTESDLGYSRLFEDAHRYAETDYLTRGAAIAKNNASIVGSESTSQLVYYPGGSLQLDTDASEDYFRDNLRSELVQVERASEIATVTTDSGNISSVETPEKTYNAEEYDLVIDATGPSAQLISTLNPDHRTSLPDLPFDKAILTTAEIDTEDITPAKTLSTTDNGVVHRIDTYSSREWVYTYSSDHTESDVAEEEFVTHIEESSQSIPEIELEHVSFESKAIKEPWIGNCVAIGSAHTYTLPTHNRGCEQAFSDAIKLTELKKMTGVFSIHTNATNYSEAVAEDQDRVVGQLSLSLTYVDSDAEIWDAVSDAVDEESFRVYQQYTADGFISDHSHTLLNSRLDDTDTEIGPVSRSVCDETQTHILLSLLGESVELYESLERDPSDDLKAGIEEVSDQNSNMSGEYMDYERLYNLDIMRNGNPPANGSNKRNTDTESESDPAEGWESY